MQRWRRCSSAGAVSLCAAARAASGDTAGIRFRGNEGPATYPHTPVETAAGQPLLGGEDAGNALVEQEKEGKGKAVGYINPDRPTDITQAGDGPVPLDFKPGQGTEIIDHHVELSENFYKPNTPVPLSQILEHEAKREHLRIYRDRPNAEVQRWEGGMPRFVRTPMHMLYTPAESRNPDMPPGPVLHDTRTGIALRRLGSMIPSPEMVVRESQLGKQIAMNVARYWVYGLLFVVAFLGKFTAYMQLRTKLRTQGISNPVLPHNRVKLLEIMWFARQDFKRYKELFNEFKETHWLPYRQSKLQQEANLTDESMKQVQDALGEVEKAQQANVEKKSGIMSSLTGLFGGKAEEENENPNLKEVYIQQLGETFTVDLTRVIIGFSPDGPVYAPPDAELLHPDQLDAKISSLRTKVVSQMEKEAKEWTSTSYDKRARDHSNEFIVQFHVFLHSKGVIEALDPDKVDKMYELHNIPRIQHLDNLDPTNTGASEGLATRAQLVRLNV